jgi:hypothetical protein
MKKDLIPPVTFGRESEKFPSMKVRIYICTVVLAFGMVTALAQETKTDTQTSTTASAPNASEVAAPTPAPAPAVANEVKPPAVAPLVQTSAVPAQHNITPAPLKPTKAVAPAPITATSAPAPAVVKEEKPAVAPPEETNAVPARPEVTTEPVTPTNAVASKTESSGTGHKGILAGGVVVLVVGLAILMWWRSHTASRGSLISSALTEDQKTREDKSAPPPMV